MADSQADKLDSIDVDVATQEILLAASEHDIPRLRRLVRVHDRQGTNGANVRDSDTGYTPLHAAILACEPESTQQTNGQSDDINGDKPASASPETIEKARATVEWLLQDGAIWNDLDTNGETPGCIARRLGLQEIYDMMVDAGVRAELLLNRLDGYEELQDEDDEEEEQAETVEAREGEEANATKEGDALNEEE
ncbi:Arginine N-methyltransferase 2, partial [Ascosphaera atra]